MKTAKLLGLSVLVAMALTSCGKGQSGQTDETPVVRVDTVQSVETGATLQYPGKVVAASDVNPAFKVAGTIRKVYVQEGDHVRAGQVLAELDPVDYKVQLKATEAEYAQIKADAERVMGLYKDGGTTASNYDKARYGLEQIEAKLQHSRDQLSDCRIYAPFDGYVQDCFFKSGETVSAGLPIVSLLSSGALEVEVNLPAVSYMHRQDFNRFSCTLDVLPGSVLPLQLISILPKANANQLYTMRLRLAERSGKIAPGMSAWVTIHAADSLSAQVNVPTTALLQRGNAVSVYVYSAHSGTVRQLPVKVIALHTDGTALVEGDVQAGELVVSSGVHYLKNGAKVRLLAPVSPTNVGGLL